MNFASIRIVTDDVDRLVTFYERLTGTKAERPVPVFAQFTEIGTTLAITSPAPLTALGDAVAPAQNSSAIIEFEVSDVDAEFARLSTDLSDLILEPTTMPWGNRSVLFRDPDGNVVNIFSRPTSTDPE